jgi:hypothetical protein
MKRIFSILPSWDQLGSVILLTLTIALPSSGSPFPIDLNSVVDSLIPDKGDGSITDELQCYGLPYGIIGFVSHILTYWTICCLILGYKPLKVWKRLKHGKFNYGLSIVSLLWTLPSSIFTIYRCRNRWQFVCIAVWKTTMSFTLAVTALHRSVILRRRHQYQQLHPSPSIEMHQNQSISTENLLNQNLYQTTGAETNLANPNWKDPNRPSWGIGRLISWWILYGLGTVVGLAGITSVVKHTFHENHKVRLIVYGFSAAVGIIAVGMGVIMFCIVKCVSKTTRTGWAATWGSFSFFFAAMGSIAVLAAFFSDWLLGALSENGWVGTPSEDVAPLYWSYFVAKRLPMFSW